MYTTNIRISSHIFRNSVVDLFHVISPEIIDVLRDDLVRIEEGAIPLIEEGQGSISSCFREVRALVETNVEEGGIAIAKKITVIADEFIYKSSAYAFGRCAQYAVTIVNRSK